MPVGDPAGPSCSHPLLSLLQTGRTVAIHLFADMLSLTCGLSGLRLGPARPHQVGLLPPGAQAFETVA